MPSETPDESGAGRQVESIGSEPHPPSTLHAAFVLLRALGQLQQHPVGVTQLAAVTGIPKTTVHRLLEQLAQEGVVQRVDRRWTFAPGLYELDRRRCDLASVAHDRLRSMSVVTGASIFLYDATGDKLTAMSRAYGARFNGILRQEEQRVRAVSPASATVRALNTGQMASEYGEQHPTCACIATPFALPSGDPAVVAFALPMPNDLDAFKRPLEQVAKRLQVEMRQLGS